MLSILAGSLSRRAVPSIFSRAQVFTSAALKGVSFQTRRPLHTTWRLEFPAAAAAKKSTGTKSTASAKKTTTAKKLAAKKPAAKKAAAKKTAVRKPKAKPRRVAASAKSKRVPKKRGRKPKAKPPVKRKRIPKELLPPKSPPSAYLLFFKRFLVGKPAVTDFAESGKRSKEAAAVWHALTEAEKQAFREEHSALREKHLLDKKAYFDNASASLLREINTKRVSRGKRRIRGPPKESADKRPMNGYLRFLHEVRPELATPGKDQKAVVKEGAARWAAMTDSQRAPYNKAYLAEFQAFKRSHPPAQA